MMSREEKEAAYQELLKLRDIPFPIPCPCNGCKAALQGEDRMCLLDALQQEEAVNHPSHYQGKKFESIDIIEDFELGFHLGNAIKYILRAGKKGSKVQDLKKAIWYLERECKNDSSDSMPLPYPSPKGRI